MRYRVLAKWDLTAWTGEGRHDDPAQLKVVGSTRKEFWLDEGEAATADEALDLVARQFSAIRLAQGVTMEVYAVELSHVMTTRLTGDPRDEKAAA